MPARPDRLFAALADPTRRGLFERLSREGEQSVGTLTARTAVSQPAVSKHLAVLKRAGLVRDRRVGREALYVANPRALRPLVDWLATYSAFWSERLDRLEELLDRMDDGRRKTR